MPTERVLAKPLSGPEVIEALISGLREALRKDCFFAPHMAYASFSYDMIVNVKFQASRITGATASVKGSVGEEDPEEAFETEKIEVSDEPKPPNEVRRDTGQEVPVLAKTPQGRLEERRVKYERKGQPKVTTKAGLTGS